MRHLWLVVLVMMAACGGPDAKSSEELAFSRLQGRPVSDVALRLGPAEQAIKRPEGTIYTWKGSAQATFHDSTTTTGMIGTTPVVLTTPTSETVTAHCRIMVYTDHQDRIIGLNHSGQNGACVSMYDRLH